MNLIQIGLWVTFGATLAAWLRYVGLPAADRLASLAAAARARREAELEHRRATCPNRGKPGSRTTSVSDWCPWCRITHERYFTAPGPSPLRPRGGSTVRRMDTGLLRAAPAVVQDLNDGCPNLVALVEGGVCAWCGRPHERSRPPAMPVPGRGRPIQE